MTLNGTTPDASGRRSGIILHPTSLPGPYGMGELGPEARRFVDYLAEAGQTLWQILPLHPPEDETFSPYAALSAFAVSHWLISLDGLVERGLLEAAEVASPPDFPDRRMDFRRATEFKWPLLVKAAGRFYASGEAQKPAFADFCRDSASWLEDYALFMALYEAHDQEPWNTWPAPLVRRQPEALEAARQEMAPMIEVHRFLQFEAARQWLEIKAYANDRGIWVLGDIPIYVAHQSADVWARPELFNLNQEGRPLFEAGVPADGFFSDEGQHWGMPVYDWDKMRDTDYDFWVERLAKCFELFDQLRIDHFRGLEAYWVIPAGAPANDGYWLKGPGHEFFNVIERRLGKMPIFVEDLGFITEAVHQLRRAYGFPGMSVAQFAFDGNPNNIYLPEKCASDMVMYTGTHDLPTTPDWFAQLSPRGKRQVLGAIGKSDGQGVHWDLIRLVWQTKARWAICPLQDIMGLGAEGRMNLPGSAGPQNWTWRYRAGDLTAEAASRLEAISRRQGRGAALPVGS